MPPELSLPARPPDTPGFPDSMRPFSFEVFEGIDTKASRPGIRDEVMAWSDGFMPLGVNNLRALWGVGDVLYTAPGSTEIEFYAFGNILKQPLAIVLLSDGSVVEVFTDTGFAYEFLPVGTILDPASRIGVSQWGSQYILIVADQPDGYFIWDGIVLYRAGSLAPTITVTAGGTGYAGDFIVTFTGGSGSGASGIATVDGDAVISIQLTNSGTGYVAGDTVTVDLSLGAGSGATATAGIMPFGVRGTTIETYQSRVWIGDGPVNVFSAPGSPFDFSTANGAGAVRSTDSFLRRGYIRYKQTNGFLYLLADSSMNYISGVSTSGSPPVTIFSNLNVDPQIGTPWADSVQVFSRNIVFANSFGVHVSYGGAVTKISQALDGFYSSVDNFNGFLPSSAVAGVFGIQVYMLLLPVIDTYTQEMVNKLLMWDGKRWWTSQQDKDLTFIAGQEIDSVLTAWGTNGTELFPLFSNSAALFQKVARSKLWAAPSYIYTKTGLTLHGVFTHTNTSGGELRIFIDNENTAVSDPAVINPGVLVWLNNSGDEVTWINSALDEVTWFVAGVVVFGPITVAQWGRLLGLTIVATASDIALVSTSLLGQDYQANT